MIEKLVNYAWGTVIVIVSIPIINDLANRINFFPSEYISRNDYIIIVSLIITYYFLSKRKLKFKNIALIEILVVLISKFGFKIGSIVYYNLLIFKKIF